MPPFELNQIFDYCLKDNPFFVFTLNKVCRNFSEILKEDNPKINISPHIMNVVPNVVSERKLIRVAGRSSGLILLIKSIFKDNANWANAWLSLKELNNRWFEIANVWW